MGVDVDVLRVHEKHKIKRFQYNHISADHMTLGQSSS